MIDRKEWKEFQESGLLLIVNQILHIFGWAIVFDINPKDKKIVSVYPARVRFRGFDTKSVEDNYIKVSEYMDKNSKILLEESRG